MGKDRTNKGTQQILVDQYTAQSSGASLQKDPPGPLEKGAEPTGAQILAATESTRHAMQTQIAAIAVDVNLLRADLRVVAERSVATEKQVTCLQSDMDTLKASVAILKAKTHKLEARVEEAKGREDEHNGSLSFPLSITAGGGRPRELPDRHADWLPTPPASPFSSSGALIHFLVLGNAAQMKTPITLMTALL
ncbi:hypothetical protein NDU88_002999 [Pleurodeles waltl]|uniref:Uncharacterized protein n=1 Tax=Pleurodeles waltl TaxID=8319 RepID=A0AAV7SC67_PLEWA|nr:hypothetical protein NDU88_002999 [Pleurodeles waltl]